VRKVWLAPVVIVTGIVVQLTVLNGLRLPGGGVPDLVLVLVVALAITEGPMAGMIIGFAAGLCLDIAPPGSELLGQYALVFCLAGWAAGRLSSAAGRSAVRALVIAAAVTALAEALAAGVGLALEPAAVTTAAVREVLPTTIGYDLLLCPFVLYLIVLATALLSEGIASAGLAGVLATPTRSERAAARRRRKLLEPRLGRAAVRPGDGWLGGGPRVPYGTRDAHPSNRAGVRLRPANGVAGSATGLVRTPGRAVHAPVNLKLAGRKRRDGAIANPVGTGLGQHWRPSRHPGLLAGARPQFRPQAGQPGGSASGQLRITATARRPQPAIRFAAHRGDATVGRTLGSGRLASPGATPRLRTGATRSAAATTSRAAVVPRLQFRAPPKRRATRSAAAPRFRRKAFSLWPSSAGTGLVSGGVLSASTLRTRRHPAAAPRFRRKVFSRRSAAEGTGLVSGGVLGASTFRARRRPAAPRLGLVKRRGGAMMIGGSGGSALRRPPRPAGRRPRFGYGRRSVLSFLAGRRIGGRWLARRRAGSRSGVSLIGRRTGGVR